MLDFWKTFIGQRTESTRQSYYCFVVFHLLMLGKKSLKSTLSRWLRQCIIIAYQT